MLDTKAETRKQVRTLLRQLDEAKKAAFSGEIIRRLDYHPAFSLARTVMLFSPLTDEPQIQPLLTRYAKEKHMLLPTVVGDDIELHTYTENKAMKMGAFGIKEATGNLFTSYADIDLVILPGVAFDKSGHRLGRGRGYYDRFLSHPQLRAKKIGICFPFQLFENIPFESHDRLVDEVITAI